MNTLVLDKQEEVVDKVNAEIQVPAMSPIDEILRQYGVLEENKQPNIASLFSSFLAQLKPEEVPGYRDLLDGFKTTSYEQPDSKKGTLKWNKNCRLIFSEYLNEMTYKINKKFFNPILIFLRLYKDYMNLYGWDIIAKYKMVTMEERASLFTEVHNAEHVPEGSNDFLRNFLTKEYPTYDKELATDLTLHLCQWLKLKNYTHTTIAPVNQII
jgi:hypothetical protein